MYVNLGATAAANAGFLDAVEKATGQDISRCYQCGKCTAGCPVANEMEVAPHQVMRFLQLGMKDEVLDSRTIWLCSTCSACTTRCPKDIDLAGIMDCLRVIAGREGRVKAVRGISVFNEIFLDSVRKYGRAFEFGIGLGHNLRTGKLIKDADIACGLMTKGRMKLLPPRIKGQREVARVFDAVRKLEEKE